MNVNEDDIVIHPRKGRREVTLPQQAILVPNPAEARIAEEVMLQEEAERHAIYNSHLYVDAQHRFCVAGPALGAPAAGLLLEKLIVLGVTRICLFSCCGTLNNRYRIGDVIIAVSGVSGEGVTQYYGGEKNVTPSQKETERLRAFCARQSIDWHEGSIWSTDAPYREHRSQLRNLHEQHGVDGVDMEFTAFCSIAAFRRVALSALFVVSDELWGTSWNPGFASKAYKAKCRAILGMLLSHGLERS